MTSHAGLQNVLNFRDVGKTVNDFLGTRRIREGLFYRSARPGMDNIIMDTCRMLRTSETMPPFQTDNSSGMVLASRQSLT
jgi:hypothetical protein